MSICEVVVRSLGDLIDKVTPTEPDPRTGRRRDSGVYRAAQSSTFTLCSDKRQSFDRFLEGHGLGTALTKFVIPAKETARFRDQLDLVSVDERRLFPDLDGVAAEMRRYYS